MNKSTITEKQTFTFAKNYSKQLKGGEIIGLVGELGAGKTIFTKGLAKGLNINKNITSPTFVIMKIYPIKNKASKIKNLVHIDAYRIKSIDDIIAIGAQDYFNRTDTVVMIEWADIIKKILPKKTKYIKIYIKNKSARIIKF